MAIEFHEVIGEIETEARQASQEQRGERGQGDRLKRAVRETLAREAWRAARLSAD